jgi:hypothetical protein
MKNTENSATEQDYVLLDEITKLRAENPDYQATFEHLRAIDRILIDQARERLQKENGNKKAP